MPEDPAQASDEERQQALADAVLKALAHKRRVEALGPFMAVLVRGRHPNHLLHFLIVGGLLSWTILIAAADTTLGGNTTAWLLLLLPAAWVCVWVALRFAWGEKRETITVDEFCVVEWERPKDRTDPPAAR